MKQKTIRKERNQIKTITLCVSIVTNKELCSCDCRYFYKHEVFGKDYCSLFDCGMYGANRVKQCIKEFPVSSRDEEVIIIRESKRLPYIDYEDDLRPY